MQTTKLNQKQHAMNAQCLFSYVQDDVIHCKARHTHSITHARTLTHPMEFWSNSCNAFDPFGVWQLNKRTHNSAPTATKMMESLSQWLNSLC